MANIPTVDARQFDFTVEQIAVLLLTAKDGAGLKMAVRPDPRLLRNALLGLVTGVFGSAILPNDIFLIDNFGP